MGVSPSRSSRTPPVGQEDLTPGLLPNHFSQSNTGSESDVLQPYNSYSIQRLLARAELFFLIPLTNAR